MTHVRLFWVSFDTCGETDPSYGNEVFDALPKMIEVKPPKPCTLNLKPQTRNSEVLPKEVLRCEVHRCEVYRDIHTDTETYTQIQCKYIDVRYTGRSLNPKP